MQRQQRSTPRMRTLKVGRALFEPLEPRTLLVFNPTGAEQYMLELMNRFRADPTNELARLVSSLGTPARSPIGNIDSALVFFNVEGPLLQSQFAALTAVPPLAWNESLYNAAAFHSQQQIDYDQQTHQVVNPPSNPGYTEPTLGQRATNAGYPNANLAENVFAFSQDVLHAHAGFVLDWGDNDDPIEPAVGGIQSPPGHRDNIMRGLYREVGIRILPTPPGIRDTGPFVVTQDFGGRAVAHNPYLLGVTYNDISGDDFYTEGEGLTNVTVTIQGTNGTSGEFVTQSMSAGGWQLQVPAGTYNITFSGGFFGGPTTYTNVVVSGANVKLDAPKGDAPPVPAAQVSGNGIDIADGDSAPTSADFTGFGGVNIQGQTLTRIFTLSNTGGANLTLSGTPRVTISGPGAANFTLTIDAALTTLTPGQSTTFSIRFDPGAIGIFNATITLDTNDPASDTYTFSIQGRGIQRGVAEISGRSNVIDNGDTTPAPANATTFGATPVPGGASVRVYTITNTGAGTLSLLGTNPVSITGPDAARFTLALAPADTALATGESTTFRIRFNPITTGARTAVITVATTDALNAAYTFTVRGSGAPSPQATVTNAAGGVIPHGDTTPSPAEKTDYGSIAVGARLARWFTIRNSGAANLVLGNPAASIGGGDAPQFVLPFQAGLNGATLAPGERLRFFIRFRPTVTGFFSTTVTVATNDPARPTYTFAIAGTAA